MPSTRGPSAAGKAEDAVLAVDPIFVPEPAAVARSQMTAFTRYCESMTGRRLADHASLHRFSVEEFREFWRLFLEWSGIIWEGDLRPVCEDDRCEYATFFPNLRLNYVENLLMARPQETDCPALTSLHEHGEPERLTRGELRGKVMRLMAALTAIGLKPGDRVAAVTHNSADAVIASLAATGVGAALSTCSPDLGSFTMINRFRQLDPTMLICHLRDSYEGVRGSLRERVAELAKALPSLTAAIRLDDEPAPTDLPVPSFSLSSLLARTDVGFAGWSRFPFNHPLFILFSSGTTGPPKCIVHGSGGTLLEHCKEHRLHVDLTARDKLFFQTACGWMMWNWQLSALASGTEIVLYDGTVGSPETLWQLVSRERISVFGTNPGFLQYCADAGFPPKDHLILSHLRAILSTGSVLFDRQFDWVMQHVKVLPLQSISGGTDIIGCFVLGNPNLPVYRGEIQCKSLALDVQARHDGGQNGRGAPGSLVCANPFPSRPLGLYGDDTGERFHDAYFSQHVGVWTHGDSCEFTDRGTARIHGRSDGVLNVRGIRIGPAEIYRILQDIPEIREAMAAEQHVGAGSRLVLLVKLRGGLALDRPLALRIKRELSRRGSSAHVPSVIAQVEEFPITHNGKRSEKAARDAVNRRPVSNIDALANPQCLDALSRHPALWEP